VAGGGERRRRWRSALVRRREDEVVATTANQLAPKGSLGTWHLSSRVRVRVGRRRVGGRGEGREERRREGW